MNLARRHVHRFEMALTRDDFLRLLPFAVGQQARRAGASLLEGSTDGVEWSVHLAEGAERRIASLALPVLYVELGCSAPDDQAVDRFVERFLRAYQRAGG
jgi:hypothetical protein